MSGNLKFQFDEYAKPNFEPYEGKEDFIFASYAHKGDDPKKVIPLLNMMNKKGFRIWYDKGIYFGDDYHEKIANRIHDCTMFIAFVSKASLAPECYCNMEIDFAVSEKFREKSKKQIAAIFLENLIDNDDENIKENGKKETVTLTPKQRMQFLATNQAGKLFDYDNLETFYSALVNNSEAILSCRGKNVEPTPVPLGGDHNVKFTEKLKNMLKNSISWLENLSKKQKIAICLCALAISIIGTIWNWRYGVPGTEDYLPPQPFDGFELVSSCTAGQFQRGLVRWETSRDFNFMNNQGNTALYVAAEKNIHSDAIKLMLNETKKLGAQEYEKRINKALILAASHNPNPEVVKEFINAGASLRYEMLDSIYSDAMKGTPLFLAAKNNPNIEMLKFLLELEDIGRRNLILRGIVRCQEKNILAFAVHNSNREILRYLIKAGANVNASNLDNETALLELKNSYGAYNAVPIQELLEAEANPNTQDKDGKTLLIRILSINYPVGYDFLTPAEVLISGGASVDIHDNQGRTALMYAAQYNFGDQNKSDVIRLLVKVGADINARDNEGNTALMLTDNSNVIKLLIENGADINAKDNNGKTALIKLMQEDVFNKIKLGNINLLLKLGADTTIQDNEGKTALMYLAQNINNFINDKETIKILIKNKSEDIPRRIIYKKVNESYNEEALISNLKLLINSSDVNIQDHKGKTALMYAPFGMPDVVKIFIDYSADVNIRDNEGKTSLMYATQCKAYEFENVTANIKALIESGADINAQDSDKNTALIIAAKRDMYINRYSIIRTLLDSGADINLRDKDENLAFHYELKSFLGFSIENLSPYKGNIIALAEHGTLAQVKNALYEGAYFGSYPNQSSNNVAIVSTLKNPAPEVFRFVLNNGLIPREREDILKGTLKFHYGSILRHVIIENPRPDILKILIDEGCNLEEKYEENRNILMEATRSSNNIDIIKILAESGIDVKAKDDTGKTASDYAMENEYLKDSGFFNEIMKILSPDISN